MSRVGQQDLPTFACRTHLRNQGIRVGFGPALSVARLVTRDHPVRNRKSEALHESLLTAPCRREEHASAGDGFSGQRIPAGATTRTHIAIGCTHQLHALVGREAGIREHAHDCALVFGQQALDTFANACLIVARRHMQDQLDIILRAERTPKGGNHPIRCIAPQVFGEGQEDEAAVSAGAVQEPDETPLL